jgi:hypothetical protein
MDSISYAIYTISIILDPSIEPPRGFWFHHPEYHGGRSSFSYGIPTRPGLIHQIYAYQLWVPYSKNLENSKGSVKDE